MHKSKSAVSAIVGGLIVLAILFTTIIPLVILLQNSYALFLHESNSRRIFDTDRSSESMLVDLIVTTTGLIKNLKLFLTNDGPITINPVRIWIIDVNNQAILPCSGSGGFTPYIALTDIVIRPGENKTIDEVSNCLMNPAFYNKVVQFLVVSERGRIFSSMRINITSLLNEFVYPYTLTVSIINMKRGRDYTIEVEPLGEGDANPRKFTHKATASNENVTVAVGVTAGRYKVTLLEDGKPPERLSGNPQVIEIPGITAVIFNLDWVKYEPVNLDVIIDAPRKVFVPQGEDEAFDVKIHIQLPKNASENVEIIEINEGMIKLEGNLPNRDITCYTHGTGFTLHPGQRALAVTCTVEVKGTGSPGTKYELKVVVPRGTIVGKGLISGLEGYVNKDGVSNTIIIQIRK